MSETIDENGVVFYRAEKQIERQDWELIDCFGREDKDFLIEFDEPVDVVSEERIQNWALDKIDSGYFHVAKNALQIFNHCQAELTGTVRPLFLANALRTCDGTKGLPNLNRKKDGNGGFVFGTLL